MNSGSVVALALALAALGVGLAASLRVTLRRRKIGKLLAVARGEVERV